MIRNFAAGNLAAALEILAALIEMSESEVREKPRRRLFTVLTAVAALALVAVGSANAETVAEPEAPDSADFGLRDSTPTAPGAEELREQRVPRYQRREEWWAHARAVLFSDIQLSAEQSRGVNEIITTQLAERRRSGELRAELKGTRAHTSASKKCGRFSRKSSAQPSTRTGRAWRPRVSSLRRSGVNGNAERARRRESNRDHSVLPNPVPTRDRERGAGGAGSSTAHTLVE